MPKPGSGGHVHCLRGCEPPAKMRPFGFCASFQGGEALLEGTRVCFLCRC